MSISCTNGTTLSTYVSIEPLHIDALKVTGAQLVFKLFEDIAQEISPYLGKASTTLADIVGVSPAFCACLEKAKILSSSNSTILITGESGTGKDLFAQALHNAGPRRKRPFIAVNCAALPRDLISSELFGYEAGAFTGAKRNGSIGKFELANGGTLFLDEIGDLPLDLQATLLRAIEQKAFMRIGGNKLVSVDVRIIAATNADLHLKISQERFREDLYYRLKTTAISLPPLRKRQEDIPLLVRHFVRRNHSSVVFSEEALQFLSQLRWPGNVRQLQNIVEGFIESNEDIDTVSKAHIATYLQEVGELDLLYDTPLLQETHFNRPKAFMMTEVIPPQDSASSIKSYIPNSRELIEQALMENHYHKQKTADQLGISKATLYRRMKEYGIT